MESRQRLSFLCCSTIHLFQKASFKTLLIEENPRTEVEDGTPDCNVKGDVTRTEEIKAVKKTKNATPTDPERDPSGAMEESA